ncbi:FtsW/RodA/SpoVE family cell cycle protein [[Clostridium] fimetarium]|uniref:Rod shape determining protein RodA n=1 Tax=[Clostridium] fimetarium TaxID=99656 RepID=A0A1I0QJD4_9FIRM|nr:FtsW/RodA/SpoVE family cell cycle protein [[Clostridium] fimetarium]SEW27039.1 rod shape determining protein RodA [[Clostridium] fimetarium]
MFKKFQLRYYNFRLVILILITSGIGVLVINSAKNFSLALRQFEGIGIGLAILIVISLIDYNWLLRYFWLMYLLDVFLLLLVHFFGTEANHAKRWMDFGFVQIQPSEFSKILLILALAKVLSMYKNRLNTWKFLLILGVFLSVPVGLVLKEPHLSTTLLTCMIIFTILYCAGLSYKIIGIMVLSIVVMIGVVAIDIQQAKPILIQPYQVGRILTFMSPDESDANSAGKYQQKYSVQAIGSGQLMGKGLNNDDASSIKNGNFIAEAQTDFIFAVIGEELGFTGGCIVLLLLALIIFECILAAIRAKDFTGRLICCGMAALVSYQTFINVGVATKLLPNTGLPLPFVSYGLSSLVALFGGMGVVINICMQRNSYDND